MITFALHIFFITGLFLLTSCGVVAADNLQKLKAGEFYSTQPQLSLIEAAAKGNTRKIDELLQDGADINARGKDGMSPLLWSMLKKNKTGFRHLLEHGANPNLTVISGDSVMSIAAIADDAEWLRLALKHGGNPSLVAPKTDAPLYQSIMAYQKENIHLLIEAGADLNYRDGTGSTPILRAAGLNRYDIVYMLLEAGADYSIGDNWDKTIVYSIQHSYIDPKHDLHQWRAKVIEWLAAKGIKAEPPPRPTHKAKPNTSRLDS